MGKPDFSRLTQRECAAMHGIDERTCRRWSDDADDPMPRNDDGTYDAPQTIVWRTAHSALDLTAERARLAKEQADKTALDNAIKRGELLSVQTVATEWSRMVSAARAKILSLPTKLAPRLAGAKNAIAIRTILTGECHAALTDLSAYRPGDGSADDSAADSEDSTAMEAATDLDRKPVGGRKKGAQRGK